MFFIFSKLLIIFLEPTLWITSLFIAAFFVKKKSLKSKLFISGLVVLLLFTNRFLLDQFAKVWDIKSKPPINQKYSCAIVLGGFAGSDKDKKGLFNASADRFIQGLILIAQKRASYILISGGNSSLKKSTFQEADFVSTQLKVLHVADSQILVENKSKNTLQNASLTKKILEAKNLKPPYLLVTSAFHMRRALYTFKSAGLDVVPYACDYKAGNSETYLGDFIPSSNALFLWNFYIREVVGYGAYYFKSN